MPRPMKWPSWHVRSKAKIGSAPSGTAGSLAAARKAVVDVVDVGAQVVRVLLARRPGDRHVAPLEHGPAGLGAGGDLDLEGLARQPAGAQRGEAPDGRGVVRPGLGLGQGADHGVGRRHLDRRVGVEDRLAATLARGRERTQPREAHADVGVVGGLVGRRGKRDPPAAALVVGVGGREPVAEQPRRPFEQLLAIERAPRRARVAQSPPPEGGVEGDDVGRQEAPAAEAIPARGEDAQGEPEVVDGAVVGAPADRSRRSGSR